MPERTSPSPLSQLPLDLMTEEEQEEILFGVSSLVFQKVILTLASQLDDTRSKQFSELLARDASPEEVNAFIEAHVPEAQAAIKKALAEITFDLTPPPATAPAVPAAAT